MHHMENMANDIELEIGFKPKQSMYIDYPIGIFSINSLEGEKLSYQGRKGFNPTVIYEMGN